MFFVLKLYQVYLLSPIYWKFRFLSLYYWICFTFVLKLKKYLLLFCSFLNYWKKNSFLSLVLKLLKKKNSLWTFFFFFQIWVTKIVFYPIKKLGTFFGRLGQSNRNCINLQNEEISKHQNNNNWNKKLKIDYFHKDVIFVLIKKEGGKRNFNLVADFLLDLPVVDEEGS